MSDRRRQGGQVIAAGFRPHVVIVTKRKIYDLGSDAVGQLLEEVFGAAVPRSLRGAKRYMTDDGWVISRPEATPADAD